jgi:dTMP kinase
MDRGRLITIEGLDGAGKTTLATALEAELTRRGLDVRLLREPGGVLAAERVREIVKDPELQLGARAEALLYAAARAQLVQEAVEPLLSAGVWVLLDRFVDSSLAYQGAGRGLGIEAVRRINEFATDALGPDRTLWLAIDPALGRRRTHARAEPLDRLEREQEDFFATIERAYEELWRADSGRIRRLDAMQRPEAVLEAALQAIADLL